MLTGVTTLEAFVVIKTTAGSGLWRLGNESGDPTLFVQNGTNKILENFASTGRLDLGVPVVDPTAAFVIYHIRAGGSPSQFTAFINALGQAGPIGHTFGLPAAPELGRSNAATPGVFDVAEVLVTTELNDQERADTFSILAQRWGLTA
jgi:hypothetical protein